MFVTSIPTSPRTYHVAGRPLGTGPVVAILTGGPADAAVAAQAATLAARTGSRLITAAAVTTTGFSINPLLHHVRRRRTDADADAILARVGPVLHSAGVTPLRTILPVGTSVGASRALPITGVHKLISRYAAAAVVTIASLQDPTGVVRPADSQQPAPVESAFPARSR